MKKLQKVGGRQKKPSDSSTPKDQDPGSRPQNIVKSLRIISRVIRAHSKLVEESTGMNATQLWMLWEIYNAPGIKVSVLADILSMHQTTCSNMLDKLQQKDLIRRDRGGPDQRAVHLYATDKGAQVVANAPRPAQSVIVDVLQRIPDEVLANMEDSLGKLVDALHLKEKHADMRPVDL